MNRRIRILTAWAVLALFPWAMAGQRSGAAVFNVRLSGAAGDGRVDDTRAVQQALDLCLVRGGIVVFPAGEYVTGTLRMHGRTEIRLESGSVLKAKRDTAAYGFQSAYGLSSQSSAGVSGTGAGRRTGLIVAKDADHVSIVGPGCIDGSGDFFFDFENPHRGLDFDQRLTRQGLLFVNPRYCMDDGPFLAWAGWDNRPGTMVVFWNCRDVRLSGVTLRNAPNWTVHFQDCDGVDVSKVEIRNDPRIPNDDGVDVYDSRNVRISDCRIDAGDDCIAVIGSEDVEVSGCDLRSRSAGIRVGYGFKDARRCVFRNVKIDSSNRGVGIFVRGAGSVEDILFSDLRIRTRLFNGNWWGKGEPVHLSALVSGPGTQGRIRNIRFSGVAAQSEAGITLWADRTGAIEDVSFDGVELALRQGPCTPQVGGNFDLRPSQSMETAVFSRDIPGLYARLVRGLRIFGMRVRWEQTGPPEWSKTNCFFTSGLECDSVAGLDVAGFSGNPAPCGRSGCAIRIRGGSDVVVRESRAERGTRIFLDAEGVSGDNAFLGNDCSLAEKPAVLTRAAFRMRWNTP